jgi:hypothetical protein
MKAFVQSKLTKKLLLLVALTGALVYLRQPDRVQASSKCPCVDGCLTYDAMCRTQCNGNQSCINVCEATTQQCLKQCGPCGP